MWHSTKNPRNYTGACNFHLKLVIIFMEFLYLCIKL